jgi:ABC-2 type transport system permease protein/oleandomycin transport system permease protein
MSSASVTLTDRPTTHEGRLSFAWGVRDTLAIAGRNLLTLVRLPQLLVFSTIQPIIFVLMFRYVFGGAVRIPGLELPYVDYLMPGIFVQTVAFGAVNTAIGLSEDLSKGLIERFRSLPMARSAVLAGRTMADLVRDVFVVALMCVVGFLVGFRIHTNALAFLGGMLVLLLFAFALAWIFALIGLLVGNAETAQAASFPVLAILVFASSAFVSPETMPGWLSWFAEHQPLSITVDAVRGCCIGGPTATYVWRSVVWSVALIAIFAPIAVRRYRRVA